MPRHFARKPVNIVLKRRARKFGDRLLSHIPILSYPIPLFYIPTGCALLDELFSSDLRVIALLVRLRVTLRRDFGLRASYDL